MGIKDFFNRIIGKFDSGHIESTTGEIMNASGLTDEAIETVSGKDTDLLTKTLGAGTKAALAAAALAGIIMPEITGIVAASVFLGTSLYKFYKESTKKAALSAIQKDGLTPNGAPIANGQVNKQQIQKVLQQSTVKEK